MDLTAMFEVEKFLCFFSLRSGTLMILWLELMSSFFFLPVSIGIGIVVGTLYIKYFMLYLTLVLCTKLAVTALILLYFPSIQNRKYKRESMNAKCIKYFAWYNGCVAAIIMLWFAAFTITLAILAPSVDFRTIILLPWDGPVLFVIFCACSAGFFVHFAAVTFSYYQSITVGHHDMGLMCNNLNDKNCLRMAPNGVNTRVRDNTASYATETGRWGVQLQ